MGKEITNGYKTQPFSPFLLGLLAGFIINDFLCAFYHKFYL